jgi:L-threonylcarbamoyladenylate synthase
MQTSMLSMNDPHALALAVEILVGGGMVAFPTDNVYQLGALAFNELAVSRISELTGRSAEKPLAVLIGEAGQLERVAAEVNLAARRLASHFWPGLLTIVLARHASIPEAVSPLATVGVRIPNFPATIELLKLCGPLAVNAACVPGLSASTTARGVQAQFEGRIALILDGGVTPGGMPSTVLDCTGPRPFILREGPIRLLEIMKALG